MESRISLLLRAFSTKGDVLWKRAAFGLMDFSVSLWTMVNSQHDTSVPIAANMNVYKDVLLNNCLLT